MMSISRNKIKVIGKKLRAEDELNQLDFEDLSVLSAWRGLHGPSLNYLLKLIETTLKDQQLLLDQYSLTQRIKRIYSIKLKLNRFTNMQLSTMDDIAGARVILENNQQVHNFYQAMKEKKFRYTLMKVNNYTSIPKPDGYRSIHLVYKTNSSSLPIQIELQIRTKLQHIWATGVEVFGTIANTSFKTGDGEEEWRTFFSMLSSRFSIKEGTPLLEQHEHMSLSKIHKELVNKIKKLNIIEKLNAYTSDYHSDWESTRKPGRIGKYALLMLNNSTNETKVEFFSEKNRLAGIEKYSNLEQVHLNNEKMNLVFISVNDMNQLEKAYPNYFMDTKTLIKILSQIVLDEF